MEQSIDALIQRIERVERSNRILKRMALLAVAGAVLTASVPQAFSKTHRPPARALVAANVIQTQMLQLLDANGNMVAVLGTRGNSAGLVFFDNKGKTALALGEDQNANKPSAGLVVLDGNAFMPGNGVARAALGINGDGAGVTALDGDQKPALVGGVNADGTGAGAFTMDSNGHARSGFGNAANGTGFFAQDANNVTRLVMGVAGDGSRAGSVSFDSNGNVQTAIGGAGNDDNAGFAAFDGNQQDRFDAGYSSANGSGLVIKDANGNVIWYAPEPAGQ